MRETQWCYAGFWIRFLASLMDSVIITVLFGIFLIPLVLLLGFFESALENVRFDDFGGMDNDLSPLVALSVLLIGGLIIVGQILYFAWFECSRHQATPGKLMVGVRVVDARGDRLTFGRALGRTLGKVLSGLICNIGYIMAGFTERKQALHDMMAATYVVEKEISVPPMYHPGPQAPPPTAR